MLRPQEVVARLGSLLLLKQQGDGWPRGRPPACGPGDMVHAPDDEAKKARCQAVVGLILGPQK